MKRILQLLTSNGFKKFAFYSIIAVFGLTFLSIPTFSFVPRFYFLTWVLTILYLGLVVLYLLLFCKIRIDYIVLGLFGFCIAAIIGSAMSGFKGFVATPFFLTAVTILTYMLCSSEKAFCKPLLSVTFLATLLFSAIFIFYYRSYFITLGFTRLGDEFGDINDIALFFSLGYFIAFYEVFFNKRIWIKIVSAISLFQFLLCGLATSSKIFVLVVIVALIAVVYMFFGKKRWWLSTIICVALIGTGIGILCLPAFATIKNRMLTMLSTLSGKSIEGSSTNDMSTIGRLEMLLDGIQLFLRRPLFGFGVNGFFTFSSYGGMWSHNHFSETLCTFGLVGTVLFHLGYYYCFKDMAQNYNRSKVLGYLLLFFFITTMLSVALHGEKIYAYLIGVIFAYTCDLKPLKEFKIIKEKTNENS